MTGRKQTFKTGRILAVLTGLALLGGCAAHAHSRPVAVAAAAPSGVIYVKTAPPKNRPHHARPSRPGPNAAWINGRWKWAGNRHVWARGHWTARPRAHSNWVAGHWNNTRRGWHWVPGHWR